METEYVGTYRNIFLPFIMEIGLGREIDFNKIISNKKFEDLVSNAIYINYLGNLESESVKKRIIQILDLLNKEIK